MSDITFFTPSYRNDLERLILLRKSINRFYSGHAKHIISVPRHDFNVFKQALESDIFRGECQLIEQQALVDKRFFPSPFYKMVTQAIPTQAWRFERYAGRAGWITQQVVKLSAYEIIPTETIVVIDSDLIFIRNFSDESFLHSNGKILMRHVPEKESAKHRSHITKSREILQVPPGTTEHNYMSSPAIIQKTWLRELARYLESTYHQPWQETLLREPRFSEYSIYGIFVEEILRPKDLIVQTSPLFMIIWDKESFADFIESPERFVSSHPERLCLVVQSNLSIEANSYTTHISKIFEKQV